MSSFYIGYLPQAPDDLRRFLRRVVALLFTVAATIAVTLVLAQQRFSPAVFEYATVRDFAGTLQAAPYPALMVHDAASGKTSRYLLVGVGKHGFSERLRELDGRPVRLSAKRIYRDEGSMLEVMPGSIMPGSSDAPAVSEDHTSLGPITVTGEIVDSKCFLGVMNPGRSKVHRDCATRCISGGIPPALLTEAGSKGTLYLLSDTNGGPLPARSVLDHIGKPVIVNGTLMKVGESYSIMVQDIRR